MNTVIKTIMDRRSIRSFQPTQIKNSDLETILECALNAPSACNAQAWHYTVIQNPMLIKYLNKTAKEQLRSSPNEFFRQYGEDESMDLFYGAPTLIIVSGNKLGVNPLVDCSAAVQNMLVCAQSLGIGSLWNGLVKQAFKQKEAREKIGITDDYVPYYGIALGYASEGFVYANKKIIREGVIDYIR